MHTVYQSQTWASTWTLVLTCGNRLQKTVARRLCCMRQLQNARRSDPCTTWPVDTITRLDQWSADQRRNRKVGQFASLMDAAARSVAASRRSDHINDILDNCNGLCGAQRLQFNERNSADNVSTAKLTLPPATRLTSSAAITSICHLPMLSTTALLPYTDCPIHGFRTVSDPTMDVATGSWGQSLRRHQSSAPPYFPCTNCFHCFYLKH